MHRSYLSRRRARWIASGALAGVAGAIGLDAGLLAWEDAPRQPDRTSGVHVAPSLAVGRGGSTVGLQGMF